MNRLQDSSFAAFVIFPVIALFHPLGGIMAEDNSPQVKQVATFSEHTAEVVALAFDREGKRVVSVSAKEVCQWDAESGTQVAKSAAKGGPVVAVRPDGPDGPTLAVAEFMPRRTWIVALRAAGSGALLRTIVPFDEKDKESPRRGGFGASVAAIAFSPDGRRLVTAGTSWLVGGGHGLHGGEVKIWDAETGELIRRFGEVRDAEYRYPKEGVEKFFAPCAPVRNGLSTSTTAGALSISADGTYVAVGTDGAGGELPESGEVWIWDAANGKVINMFTMKKTVPQGEWASAVTAVALSHDNKHVAASVGGRPNRRDGLILAPGPTAELRIWEVASGRQVRTLRGHEGAVAQLAFSPDGKWLASAGSDRTVRLWNMSEESKVIVLPMDTPQVNTLAFNPDGSLLSAGGGNGNQSGEARVWAIPRE